MTEIAEHHIERLRNAGLFVSEPFPSKHAMPDGVFIGKPASVSGNSIPGYKTGYVLRLEPPKEEVSFNAATIFFFSYDGKWIVDAVNHCGGVGPGDFVDDWDTPEEAVNDILEFYFGDPARMQVKADAHRRLKERAQQYEEKQKQQSAKEH